MVHTPVARALGPGNDNAIDGAPAERPGVVARGVSQRARRARVRHLLELRHVAEIAGHRDESVCESVFLVEGGGAAGPGGGPGGTANSGGESGLFRHQGQRESRGRLGESPE